MASDKYRVLLVDDDPGLLRLLSMRLTAAGYEVTTVESAEQALAQIPLLQPHLMITDLQMSGMDGMALFNQVHSRNPSLPVLILTAHGTIPDAVEATSRGVFSYLTKPFDSKVLLEHVARALKITGEPSGSQSDASPGEWRRELVTRSPLMENLLTQARLVAGSDASVLIHGQSGTGKELLARAIHHASPRRRGPLVAVNVAALPETLLESELFGHERGAFTGAEREHRGRFELADGGTLFLDEIGDLPRGTQVKLLRVLQEQAFERLGGTRQIQVDVRLVAATHRDLEAMVRAGEFRDDLFFRLNVVAIGLPPLRERREDVPLLVDQFLRRFASEGKARSVSREAMDLLLKHDYPGNVRELENLVHRAIVLARGDVVTTADLPLHLGGLKPEEKAADAGLPQRVEAFERALIHEALQKSGGVQTRAAAALGISERHLRYKLKKYRI